MAALSALMLASCNELSLSDEQKHSSVTDFDEAVGSIDPDQAWNIRLQGTSASGIEVTPVAEQTATRAATRGNNGMSPIEAAQIEKRSAEFFRVTKQGNHQFKTKLVLINSEMDKVSVGAYYYDNEGKKHETDLFKDYNPKNYKNGSVDVKINGGSYFGIWVECTKGEEVKKYYSEASLNADEKSHTKFIRRDDDVQGTSRHAYIFIEDSFDGDDYTNIVLKVDGNEELDEWPIDGCDSDMGPWLLFCEDVGSKGDNDFNDVVLKVTRREGENKIDVEFMAVGSTVPVYVFFGDTNLGEAHAIMGVDSTKKMINTYMDTTAVHVVKTLDVPSRFTLASENMAGFTVVRGTEAGPSSVRYEGKKGFSPFMICVPEGTQWTKESVKIWDAYPQFIEWAQDMTKNTEWYLHPAEGLTIAPAEAE